MMRLDLRLCLTASLLGVGLPGTAFGQPALELILGRPTDDSITLGVRADAGELYVEYGTEPGALTAATPPIALEAEPAKLVLDGLEPDTRYYYRVWHRAVDAADFVAGDEHTFVTQRARGGEFTFTLTADSHQGFAPFYDEQLYYTTLSNIRADAPDFHIDLGDAISLDDFVETEASVAAKYLDQRRAFAEIGHSAAVFLVLGNHENEEGWNLDDTGDFATSLPVLGANARKKYFVNPVPDDFYTGNLDDSLVEISGDHLKENYYAFEWGDALFVAVDPFWYTMRKPYAGGIGGERTDEEVGNRWDWTLGLEQYEWLRQTLEGSDARYKFVFAHQLAGGTQDYSRGGALGAQYCEWGGYDVDGETWMFDVHRPDMVTPIHDLMVANGVDIFFHGHDHVFVTEQRDGVIYQECPHAANDSYNTGFPTNVEDYEGELIANSGHVRVTVSGDAAQVEYVRAFLPGDEAEGTNGSIDAAYSVEAKPTNQKPTAFDDAVQTLVDTAVVIDVLANDVDPDGDALEVIGVSQPAGGRAVNRFGDVYYEPDPGYCTTSEPDRFQYSVRDGKGGSHTAVVEVEVGCNSAPLAVDDAFDVVAAEPAELDVLANDLDPDDNLDPATLSVVEAPSQGQLELTDAGTLRYQPSAAFTGHDSFSYRICDRSSACAQATVTLSVSCDSDAQCQTGEACDVARCEAGACVVAPLDCDDGIACTADTCIDGTCQHAPMDAVCSSDDACVVAVCEPTASGADARGCSHAERACDDGNPCTNDSCDAELGCVSQPTAGACDDGNPCTLGDSCVDGSCIGAGMDCSALDEACRVGTCLANASGSCSAVAVPDGEACAGGICIAGQCQDIGTSDDVDAGPDAGAAADAASDARAPLSDPQPDASQASSTDTTPVNTHPDDVGDDTSSQASSSTADSLTSETATDPGEPWETTETETSEELTSSQSGETETSEASTLGGDTSEPSGADSETSEASTLGGDTSEPSGADSETVAQRTEPLEPGADAGYLGIDAVSGGGCGCTVGERSTPISSASWWLGALAALWLRSRRR